MIRKTRSYREALLKRLVDPAEAEAYLNAAAEDSEAALQKALGNVIEARSLDLIPLEVDRSIS